MSSSPRVLIYLLRRDLRVHDNPVFHEIAKMHSQSQQPFTHLLPVFIFPSHQIETSGFLTPGEKSPYPEARSQVGHFWRCGPHRATFLAESVWDVKKTLESVGSGLEIRVGMVGDVVKSLVEGLKDKGVDIHGVWMTAELAVEERREERAIRREVEKAGSEFKLWTDEKYYVHDDDCPVKRSVDVPDVFTSYKKMVEPLSDACRKTLPSPQSLPPLPPSIPSQSAPFQIPSDLSSLISALHKPLTPASMGLSHPPTMPSNGARTAIPFKGGAHAGHERLTHLLSSSAMTHYKDTRNGMLGPDFSSKLSAWLALGCLTAREVHWALADFESGANDAYKGASGYAAGENKGTAHMRFELLWRDYFRLTTWKFGPRLFRASGFRADTAAKWSTDPAPLQRWLAGTTGTGLVDASQRELFLTGYTSNRARQNVASFLAKHLGLDWRLGAEWYEACLVDYDVASNWGNWQYTAGVGNDPREGGGGRKFNPVKQAHDYDPRAEYIQAWVPELRGQGAGEAMQAWTIADEGARKALGEMAEDPLVRIHYKAGGGGGYNGRGRGGGRGGKGRGGKGRGGGRTGFSKGNGMDLIG